MPRPSAVFDAFTEPRRRLVAGLLLAMAIVYLVPFVDRGWVPIDEGMVGQAAERVLKGQLPHVDYEEPYPGTMSYFYAAVFGLAGVDLLYLRWTVFAAAVVSLGLVYGMLRRYLDPVMSALATWAALCWTFPNYFSSLPSWWILLCALVSVWGVIRYIDTQRLAFAVVAGLAAGLAATIKQTGFFLFPPLVMSLMMSGAADGAASSVRLAVDRSVRYAAGLLAFAFVVLITKSNLGSGEVVYLLAPIAGSCLAFSLFHRWTGVTQGIDWRATVVALIAAAVPIAVLLMPHISAGEVPAFVNGVFVVPQKRLQFTLLSMRPATQIVAGFIAVLWIFWAPRSLTNTEFRVLVVLRWIIGIGLGLLALRSHFVYTFIWEAVRGTAALLPLIALWLMATKKIPQPRQQRVVFATSAMLAWASLGQFPFAAPIYFCYVAPLGLIAGVATVQSSEHQRRLSDGPALAAILLYALLSMNRGYVWNLGWFYAVHDLSTPLDLPRAHLKVASYEAAVFRRVVPLVQQHLGPGGLKAGPDTPDIYFLTGQFSKSGQLFDFFSSEKFTSGEQELATWTAADVIVFFHGTRFSPSLSETLISSLRKEFPQGESVPPFEVRWR